MVKESLLIALGGNAISIKGEEGNIKQQFTHSREAAQDIVELLKQTDCNLILTHGNGPQVGNVILRSELTSKFLYTLPLDICVSDTEGGMGYMIQQVMHNKLMENDVKRNVVSIITQVIVDENDSNFNDPTKPIGRFYTKEEAEELKDSKKWTLKEDSGRGYRRVVASPKPLDIIEADIIQNLSQQGTIVIAAGGGGIPVVMDEDKSIYGVEAVIDKDLASALLAHKAGVQTMIILTSTDAVYLNYGTDKQMPLKKASVSEVEQRLQEGHFARGSMLPKIQACINFIRGGGSRAIIADTHSLLDAYHGRTGTQIVPNAAAAF